MQSFSTNEKRIVVRGIGEIALRVNSLETMRAFYEEVMGLLPDEEEEDEGDGKEEDDDDTDDGGYSE